MLRMWMAAAFGLVATAAGAEAQTTFSMPSGNVECVYMPAGGSSVYTTPDGTAELSCDRSEPSYIRVSMTERSKVKVEKNVGDRGCCGTDNPLAYGKAWQQAPFSCESKQTGLTCRRADGRGFSISKAAVRPF